MELEKKYFEGLNADDDINLLAETDYINAENFRIGTTDVGSALRLESIGGTIHLHSLLPAPTHQYTPLCAVEDEERRRIIYFMHYTDGTHQIRCHDRVTGINYLVMDQSKVPLNFSKNKLIQAKVYGDLLYYTDDTQEIKVINIEAGIKTFQPTYVTDVKPYSFIYPPNKLIHEDITLLRRPPIYPPTTLKQVDTVLAADKVNLVRDNAFQFAWRYLYRDFQYSVIGSWSELEDYNEAEPLPDKDFNRFLVTMSTLEWIPETVLQVELIVKNMDTLSVQAMHVWNRDNPNENTSIIDHNQGVAALATWFYNDKAGIDVPKQEAIKDEEMIPRWCKTLDTARKRLFLANYVEGFNSPLKTSLQISLVDANTATSVVTDVYLFHITYRNITTSVDVYRSAYYVKLTGISVPGWYLLVPFVTDGSTQWPPLLAPFVSFSFTDIIYVGATEVDAYLYNTPVNHYMLWAGTTHVDTTGDTTITDLTGEHTRLFKTNSSVQVGVAFYDRLKRRIGMYADGAKAISIPDRAYGMTVPPPKSAIGWTLNTPPVVPPATLEDEIPKEAYYYSVVMTKNLRTRYFVQTLVDECRYAAKDVNGVINVDPSVASPANKQYIAIDIASLLKDGMGWQITPGDLCRIWFYDGQNQPGVTLAVVGEKGRYILCEYAKLPFGATHVLTDVTFTTAHKMIVEFYRPYKPSAQEDFFEVGNMFRILNPETSTRTYSQASGTIMGDAHALDRKSFGGILYIAEAMSSNDKFWQTWHTDAGKVFPGTKNKEIRRPFSIAFSNVYVIGTQVNGLSAFEVLDTEDVSPESGAIQKLLLTSKVQDDGTVMLIICYTETLTMYLGEAQISDAGSTAFFVKSTGVIGSINSMRGSFGTQNAESVVLHRGQAFWYDGFNGCFVRYDVNGLFPISDYKMKRVAKLIGDQYLSMNQAQIEALGSRPFIFGGVDPYHNEVLWAIPKLAAAPPKGYLMDYVSYVEAKGYIGIIDIGNDGDKIEVFVNDPVLGTLSLGFYIKQATDTTTAILAASIATVINTNPYGYSATSQFAQITITARPGLGASMNGGGTLYTSITPVVATNIMKAGATDKLLINATDKLKI